MGTADKLIQVSMCDECGHDGTGARYIYGTHAVCPACHPGYLLRQREQAGDMGFEDDGRLESYAKVDRLPYSFLSMVKPAKTSCLGAI